METMSQKRLYDDLRKYISLNQLKKQIMYQIKCLQEDISTIHAVSYDTVLSQTNTNSNESRLIKYLEQKNLLLEEFDRVVTYQIYVETILDFKVINAKERMIMKDIFINGLTFKDVATKYYYNETSVYKFVYRVIEKLDKYMVEKNFVLVEEKINEEMVT